MPSPIRPLHQLAAALGVDVEITGWQGGHTAVSDGTLREVLAALGVDAADDGTCRAALDRLAGPPDDLPPYVVARESDTTSVRTTAESATLELENGESTALEAVDGGVTLPDDLPIGYHVLRVGDRQCTVIRPPRRMAPPDGLGERPGWGLATQLYSVRSETSWGLGDLHDLTTLAQWSATEHGADFVLINPLHAAEVVAPMQPSPYLPTTRSFANPIYLDLARVPGYEAHRERVETLAEPLRATDGLLDRDATWAAKREALTLLHAETQAPPQFDDYRTRTGAALRDFATWCALTEHHGTDFTDWPEPLRHPGSDAVADFAARNATIIEFHEWLQWLLDEQLTAVQRAATDAGMRVGIVHDVAVGVSPIGADAWARHDQLATSISVGAPPDAYSQTGQDWDQPPWRPDRLAQLAYAPFRELFGSVLRHSGGLRVDHVIGLFRLWWIPRGRPSGEGTYVHYDHDALIGTLMIEAARTGAVLIGEDLGNVEPWVRDYLRERGVLGTSILWFENDEQGDPLPPEHWRELCLASVTTHDLPPTAGYLAGEHVRLRHELGLLTESYDSELARDSAERERWLAVLRKAGLLASGDSKIDLTDPADVEAVVLALHRLLGRAPSLLRCAALVDAVGDTSIQNQPGTTQEQYPNWRVPLRSPDGASMLLEQVMADPRCATLLESMRTDG